MRTIENLVESFDGDIVLVPEGFLDLPQVSLAAKGLYAYLHRMPEGEIDFEQLAVALAFDDESEAALLRACQELHDLGEIVFLEEDTE